MPLFGKDPTKLGTQRRHQPERACRSGFPGARSLGYPLGGRDQAAGWRAACLAGRRWHAPRIDGFVTRMFGENEDYMRAYPPVNGQFSKKHDLFDGI